jgi:hypothetical protein
LCRFECALGIEVEILFLFFLKKDCNEKPV